MLLEVARARPVRRRYLVICRPAPGVVLLWRCGEHDAVSTFGLGPVERLVGAAQQVLEPAVGGADGGDADRYRERELPGIVVVGRGFNHASESFAGNLGLIGIGTVEQDDEFLAALARHHFARTTNSSPPWRATISPSRQALARRWPMWRKAWSPTSWPKRSLIDLK